MRSSPWIGRSTDFLQLPTLFLWTPTTSNSWAFTPIKQGKCMERQWRRLRKNAACWAIDCKYEVNTEPYWSKNMSPLLTVCGRGYQVSHLKGYRITSIWQWRLQFWGVKSFIDDKKTLYGMKYELWLFLMTICCFLTRIYCTNSSICWQTWGKHTRNNCQHSLLTIVGNLIKVENSLMCKPCRNHTSYTCK